MPEPAAIERAQPKTVLIVDDDDGMRDTLVTVLRDDYRCFTAESAEQALAILQTAHIDFLLADVRLPGMDGISLVARVKADIPDLEIIVLSVLADVEMAVRAMKAGAFHYMVKDFNYETLHALLANASERQDLRRLAAALQDQIAALPSPVFVGGASPATQRLLALVKKVAPLDTPLLITGETGTGKTLLAHYVHVNSSCAAGPFIEVLLTSADADTLDATLLGYEAGAIPGATRRQRGKFELAAGGTLFLDEVADLPPALQARLVRILQQGHTERLGSRVPTATSFRLIVATRRDLAQEVRMGRFREDLYYRLCVIPVHVPPLRERLDDLPALIDHFLERLRSQRRTTIHSFTPDAVNALQYHDWTGNVRELASLIERLVTVHDEEPSITARHLPTDLQLPHLRHEQETESGALSFAEVTTRFEQQLLVKALENARGNLATAARELGMPLSTLKYKVRRHRLRTAAGSDRTTS
jgi:DNA-binding NtrC family response regulator